MRFPSLECLLRRTKGRSFTGRSLRAVDSPCGLGFPETGGEVWVHPDRFMEGRPGWVKFDFGFRGFSG